MITCVCLLPCFLSPQVLYCVAVLLLLFFWKTVVQRAVSPDSLPTYVVGIDESNSLWAANIIPGYVVLVLGSLQLAEFDRTGTLSAVDAFFQTYGPFWQRVRALVVRARAMYVVVVRSWVKGEGSLS